jgi:hypothetical protein
LEEKTKGTEENEHKSFFEQMRDNFRVAGALLIVLTMTFTITLSVFPAGFFKPYSFWKGVFSDKDKITSYHNLTVGLIFNIFDTVGR